MICAGQGPQVGLDFAGLRPSAGDPAEAQVLWQAAGAALGAGPGADWHSVWSALTADAQRANRAAQLAVALWQGLQWLRVRDRLPAPAWVAGYSAGEVAAHAIAGSLAFADVPALMVARATAMDQACGVADGPCLVLLGARLPPAARLRRTTALQVHGLQLAIQRSAAEAIWAAPAANVTAFLAQAAGEGGWDARAVDVRVPSHSPWLQAALPPWQACLQACAVAAPRAGILAGIHGDPVRSAEAVRQVLAQQLVQTITWDAVLQALHERGVTRVLDLGPGNDQSRLVEAACPAMQVIGVADL